MEREEEPMKRPVLRRWRRLVAQASGQANFVVQASCLRFSTATTSCRRDGRATSAGGYTLVEILVSTTLALMLLGSVVLMFSRVGESINDSRSMLEAADRLRLAADRLQMDLTGLTVTVNPPRDPANNEGYLEIIEGPVGTTPPTGGGTPMALPSTVAANSDHKDASGNPVADTTVGDFDDILMFTTRSTGRPFVGLCASAPERNDPVRGGRGGLVYPWPQPPSPRAAGRAEPRALARGCAAAFYKNYDVSARVQGTNVVANTLGDLTDRRWRFAHPTDTYPFDVRRWGPAPAAGIAAGVGLPTLRECSYAKPGHEWTLGTTLPPATPPSLTLTDFWTNAPSGRLTENCLTPVIDPTYNPTTDTQYESRFTDNIILTNVIGFDVKVWDPTYKLGTVAIGAYVDLGYNGSHGSVGLSNSLAHIGMPWYLHQPVDPQKAR